MTGMKRIYMEYPTIRGCIMDVDGTILDSMSAWMTLGRDYLAARGITADEELDRTLYPLTTEQASAYLIQRYGLKESVESVSGAFTGMVARFYKEEVQAKPGAIRFLRKMKSQGIPVVLATSNAKELVCAAFQRLGILDTFSGILTSAELNTDKTKPDIYLAAGERIEAELRINQPGGALKQMPEGTLTCSRRNIAVFEDTLFASRSAKDAGFYLIGVEDDASRADREKIRALCDIFLSDYRDLPEIFAGNTPIFCRKPSIRIPNS